MNQLYVNIGFIVILVGFSISHFLWVRSLVRKHARQMKDMESKKDRSLWADYPVDEYPFFRCSKGHYRDRMFEDQDEYCPCNGERMRPARPSGQHVGLDIS